MMGVVVGVAAAFTSYRGYFVWSLGWLVVAMVMDMH